MSPERRDDLNPRREKDYSTLDIKIDEKFEELTTRLRRFFTKALFAFAIIGLCSAFGLLGFGLSLRSQQDTTNRIQHERYLSLRNSCIDQNNRHDATIKALPKPKPSESDRYIRVKLLIDALAPIHEDCVKYAERRVNTTTNEGGD